MYGGGTLDGNGQVWYDLYANNPYTLRPVLFGTIGLHGGMIADLNLRHSPQYYNFVANSSEVVFSGISIAGASTSKNEAKNTDGTSLITQIYSQESVADLWRISLFRVGYLSKLQHHHSKLQYK